MGTKCCTQDRTPQAASIRQQFCILQVGLYRPWNTRCIPASPSSFGAQPKLSQGGIGPESTTDILATQLCETPVIQPDHLELLDQRQELSPLSITQLLTLNVQILGSRQSVFSGQTAFYTGAGEPVIHFEYTVLSTIGQNS